MKPRNSLLTLLLLLLALSASAADWQRTTISFEYHPCACPTNIHAAWGTGGSDFHHSSTATTTNEDCTAYQEGYVNYSHICSLTSTSWCPVTATATYTNSLGEYYTCSSNLTASGPTFRVEFAATAVAVGIPIDQQQQMQWGFEQDSMGTNEEAMPLLHIEFDSLQPASSISSPLTGSDPPVDWYDYEHYWDCPYPDLPHEVVDPLSIYPLDTWPGGDAGAGLNMIGNWVKFEWERFTDWIF